MQDRHHPPEGGTGGIQDSGQIAGPPHAAVHGTDLGHRQSSHPAGTRGSITAPPATAAGVARDRGQMARGWGQDTMSRIRAMDEPRGEPG